MVVTKSSLVGKLLEAIVNIGILKDFTTNKLSLACTYGFRSGLPIENKADEFL